MSTQNATVSTSPAPALLSRLFSSWGTKRYGSANFSCTSTVVPMQNISATWDGAKLTMSGTVNVPCSGTLTKFEFRLADSYDTILGIGSIEQLNISVTQNQTVTIYYIENLSKPTTAPIQVL